MSQESVERHLGKCSLTDVPEVVHNACTISFEADDNLAGLDFSP